MSTQSAEKNKKLVQAGALGFSLFFHVGLLLLIGGAVLIEGIIPKPTFTDYMPMGETIDDVTTTTEEEQPQENTDPLNSNEPVLEQTVAPMPDVGGSPDVILMDSPSSAPSFTMPAANPNATGANTFGSGSSGGSGSVASSNNATKSAIRSMTSLFGSKGVVSDALVGYLYDLKQKADKTPSDMMGPASEVLDTGNKFNRKYAEILTEFVRSWNSKVLDDYYKSPDALSSYQIFIPSMQAGAAPNAFKVQKEVRPLRIAVHYKGNFTAPTTGKFRFVGWGDDVLAVRFNRKTVLDAGITRVAPTIAQEAAGLAFVGGPTNRLTAGEWFSLNEGKSYPIEVLIGEQPGGIFYAFLMIEEKGADYEQRVGDKGPLLPVFQMAPTDLPKFKPDQNVDGGGPAIAKVPFSGKPPEEAAPATP